MEGREEPAPATHRDRIHTSVDGNDNDEMESQDTLSKAETNMEVTDEVLGVHSGAGREKERDNSGNDEGLQESLVHKLGLTKYFPEKISLQTVMMHSSGKLESLSDIPWYVLSKILMLDYRARDDIMSVSIEKSLLTHEKKGDSSEIGADDFDDIFSQFASNNASKIDTTMPHPLDVLLISFLSSSNFMRQILCEKLFMCKLSIPLVIPPVCNHESMFFLWSLRNVVLECKLPNGSHFERSAVKHPIPVVSCMRLGEISRSKSKFMNEILNDQSHPTFFHRDCQNGMNRRILSDGLLEIAWYFHSDQNKNNDLLDVDVAFVNLRGDGVLEKTSKSRKFLFCISSVVLVMVDINKLDEGDICDSLEEIAANSYQMILMLTKVGHSQLSEKNKECVKKCVQKLKGKSFGKANVIFDFDFKGERNIKDLKKETGDKIKRCFKENPNETTVESYKELAADLHLEVDENFQECNRGKRMAVEVIDKICEGGKENLKARYLPLQCTPWVEWARINTEEHRREKRGTDAMSNYMDTLSVQKKNFRQEQLQLLKGPNIITDIFIDHLVDSVKEENLYFLKWLKLNLDEISKEILPALQKKCSLKWNAIRLCEDNDKIKALQGELEECEEKLAESSCGLEHFMRELAQAYEAVCYMGQKNAGSVGKKIHLLPRIMAKLMLLGYPLEIMDGDAAHVPVKWVQAVLKQLSQIIGDKKIFVLSVLGIQSSGKSTLLNTMFGLQFSVAAGRCTRGVYAQLVPVCKEYSDAGYDYILVVDTEGLRAAELGKAKLQHDNEIATLVIGLGDVTLVNVKGENVSEMEDVLQIVIHALLKMCLVNKNLALQPSCIFLHQNVSAPDASLKLRTGQQKFMETLDKVTKSAGKQEDAPEYTKFKQLIKFDINTDITYVSDLWKGDPPMASANPGYSENVNKVKQLLLTKIMPGRSLHLTANRFSTRLNDLWNGILDQNFVFSFKNSLEMDAYNLLEKKLSSALWLLKKTALQWFNAKKNEIENRDHEIEGLGVSLVLKCHKQFDENYNDAREDLQELFATDDDKSILEQWRVSTFLRLQTSYDDIIDRTIENIKCEIAKRQIKLNQRRDVQGYINKIIDEAKILAENLRFPDREEPLSEEELNRRFKERWDEWMEMVPQRLKEEISVEERMNDALEKIFKHDCQLLDNARDKRSANIFRGSLSYALNTYVSGIKVIFPYVTKLFKKKEGIAMKYMNKLLEEIEKQVMKTSKWSVIQEIDAQVLIAKVSNTTTSMESELKFSNKEKFEICMAIFFSQYICTKYSRKCSFDKVGLQTCKLANFGIQPIFEKALVQKFSSNVFQVLEETRAFLRQQTCSKDFPFLVEEHIHSSKAKIDDVSRKTDVFVNKLFDQVRSYIGKKEIQYFRDEYIEEIIHKIAEMEKREKDIEFTKTFRIDLAVYLCQFAIPVLKEKHKRHAEDMDQRFVYDRDNYRPCLERFKNFYYRFTGDQALANVLSERLNKAIENAVDKDLARELANDVRSNVSELSCKPAFLKAVLHSLLEVDDFEQFYLYLNDTDACFETWLARYVDTYLYSNGARGHSRYLEIAFRKIDSLVSTVCEEISISSSYFSEVYSDGAVKLWIERFRQQLIDKLPLPLEDFLNLAAGYNISSLNTVTSYLCQALQDNKVKLREIFQNHNPDHQRHSHENNVYTMIGEECKGCTEKCPFCYAPCYLNTVGHTEAGRQHMALEHHSQACGRYRFEKSEKLVTENCSMLVAGDSKFKCTATGWKGYPYKKYKDLFPHWDIYGDPSVEATPYWKWFLKKYAEQLADRYRAKVPNIPTSWNDITKEKAFDSLRN